MVDSAFFVLVIVALAACQLGLGIAMGWWLRERRGWKTDKGQQVGELMQDLQELAISVGDEVGEHSSRMEAINEELNAIEAGNGAPQEQIVGAVAKIVAANKQLQDQLYEAEQRIQEQAKAIDHHLAEARVDPLTELANRRAFNDEMQRRFAELQRTGHPLSLAVIDIDHFKKFNDTYGHQAGDQVLRHVSKLLVATLREMDLVARYGGEEFALVLPNTDLAKGERAAERVRQAIEKERFMLDGVSVGVTVSAGVAEAGDSDNPRSLFKRADLALYAAKEAGRNRTYLQVGTTNRPAGPVLAPVESLPPPREPEVHTDALTGLPNRRQFVDELRKLVVSAGRTRASLSLVFVGIDQLTKGAAFQDQVQTDRVLQHTAEVLCREVGPAGTVLRCGWEEFGIILPASGFFTAHEISKRLHTVVPREISLNDSKTPITISTGITELVDSDDAGSFARRAEEALEASRAAGGNCSHVHRANNHELQLVD